MNVKLDNRLKSLGHIRSSQITEIVFFKGKTEECLRILREEGVS